MDEAIRDGTEPRRYQQGQKQTGSEKQGTKTLKRAGGEILEEGLVAIKHMSDFMCLKMHVHTHVHEADISASARCCFVCW